MKYSIEELVECVEREIKFRKNVYPKWVELNRIKQAFANEQIDKMEAVRDYLKKALPAKQLKFGVEL